MSPFGLGIRKLAGLAMAAGLAAAGFASAEDKGRFDVTVERLTDGVYVARRVPSWRPPVQTNVTIIVNENDVVVVDGGGYPAHVENVIAEIREITDKPVSVIVTTHWHQDHNFGIHRYRNHYPDVRIVSHENARSALQQRNEESIPRVTGDGYLERLTGILEERIDKAGEEHPRVLAFFEDYLAGAKEIAEDLKRARSNLADETFDRRLVLHRPGRTIEVLYLGRTNTDGDAIVWLPGEKIVATGDVVVHPTPYGFGSYPKEWAATLHRIKDLDYEILVPGHGEVQRDDTYVSTLVDLMESVSSQTEAAVAAGASSVDEVRAQIDLGDFDQRFAGGDPLLLHLFDIWFKTPILQSSYKQAVGEEIE